MKKLFNKIKAYLLLKWSVELVTENNNLKTENRNLDLELRSVKQILYSKQNIIISKTMMINLIRLLPDVNDNRHKFGDINYLKKLAIAYQDSDKQPQTLRVAGLIPVDTTDKNYLNTIAGFKIQSSELGITFDILFVLRNNLVTNIKGVDTQMQTYVWDFRLSGIQVIGDDSLNVLKQFMLSMNRVLKELDF